MPHLGSLHIVGKKKLCKQLKMMRRVPPGSPAILLPILLSVVLIFLSHVALWSSVFSPFKWKDWKKLSKSPFMFELLWFYVFSLSKSPRIVSRAILLSWENIMRATAQVYFGCMASHPCTWHLRWISMSKVCSNYDFSLLAQQSHWILPTGMENCSSHEATVLLQFMDLRMRGMSLGHIPVPTPKRSS